MARYKAVLSGLTLVTVLSLTTACGSSGGSGSEKTSSASKVSKVTIPNKPESGTFRIGTQPWIGYGPWYIAEQKNYGKAHGISFNQVNFTTDDQVNAAFAAGKIDGANIATHTALNLIASGVDLKIVAMEDVSRTADAVMAGPGINSVADLKGKKVAYEEGTTSDILLRYALKQNGMTIDDIKKVPMPAADAGTAFVGGKVDAAVTYEPYIAAARAKDSKAKIIYNADKNPGLISDVFVVKSSLVKEKPGQIGALMKVWEDSVAEYYTNKAPSQKIIAKGVGEDAADLTTGFDGILFYDTQENSRQLGGTFLQKTLPDVAAIAKDAGILKGNVDLKTAVDDQFVKWAAKNG